MEQTKENKMGTQPILRLIISMSLPAMFSMLVQSLYNIIDSMFVAQLGEEALTSVSLAFPIQMLIISVAVGTGVGLNSLVSRRLGQKNQQAADNAATHGLVLAIFNWALFALIGLFATKPFLSAFTDNARVLDMGCSYLYIVSILSMGVFIELNIEKTLQATGNMIYPMIFQLVGAITNIIFDPLFIFGLFGFPKLGVTGAAVATVLGQILAMLLSIYVMLRKKHAVHVQLKGFKFHWKTVKDIYAVGFPSIIMQSIGSFLVTGLNAILISFSEAAVSVLGVYFKLQSFITMPVFGLTGGVMPIMGYNFGAKNKKRLLDTLKWGCIIGLCMMFAGLLLFLLIPKQLLMIFNASDQMLQIGIPALRIISMSFLPAAIGIMFSTLFQAVGMGSRSLLISVLRQLVIILPAAYFLSKLGLGFVWLAVPAAEIVSLVISVFLFLPIYRRTLKNLSPLEAAV